MLLNEIDKLTELFMMGSTYKESSKKAIDP